MLKVLKLLESDKGRHLKKRLIAYHLAEEVGSAQRGNYQGIRKVLEIHTFISLQRVERGDNSVLEVVDRV